MLKRNCMSQKLVLAACLAAPWNFGLLAVAQNSEPATDSVSAGAPAVQSPIDTRESAPVTEVSATAATQDAKTPPAQEPGAQPTLENPGVKELGGDGSWFADNVSWLQWGPIGVRSADASYSYSTFTDNTPGSPTQTLSGSLFRANLAFDKQMSRSRLVLQYNPSVFILDGRVSSGLANQTSSFDMLFVPTARVTIGINDLFDFQGGQNNILTHNLDRTTFIGALVNPFLDNGRERLANFVAIPVSYRMTARTSFTVSPFVGYARADVNASTATQSSFDSTLQYGARAQFNHMLSQSTNMGVFYAYQEVQDKDFSATSYFNSLGVSASHRFRGGLVLSGEAGGSHLSDDVRKQWNAIGSVSLAKFFQRSSIQATYGRDTSFTGLLGHGYSQYSWVNYKRELGQKLDAIAGFGYLSGPNLGPAARGKYVHGSLDYVIFGNLSCFVGYVQFWQSGNPQQLTVGDQSQIQVGLRWKARRRVETRN